MGIARGPNLVKDNLVFGYDTGYGVADNSTATRFYPGKPTTNLLTLSGAQSLDVRTDIYSNTTKTNLGGGKYRFVNDGTGGSTIRLYTNLNDLVNGTTYGCSVSYENFNPGDGTAIILDWSDQNNTAFSYANYGSSNRIFMTGARSTYDSTFRFLDISLPVNSAITLFNAQVELSTPSPFTDSTRSDTTSLIDLKKTSDIDVSNVSFSSTGQPEFDGTDDYIQIPDPNVSSSNGFSIEMIIKPSNASSSPMVITPNSGGIDHFVRFNSNGRLYMRMIVAQDSSAQDFTTTTSLSSTDYHYVVFTFKQSEGGKAYYNGSQESAASANFTALDWSSVWKIGQRGNNTFFFDGELPILKVHNQVLSANQVKQNYKAYKNRFDI